MANNSCLFERDCLPIVASAQLDSERWARVALFTLLTIRQPLIEMPRFMRAVEQDGADSVYLFGWKRAGYLYLQDHKAELAEAARNYAGDLDSLIYKYMAVPGFGIAKASFLAQMTVGDGACLDGHNLARLGIDRETFHVRAKTKESVAREMIARYRETWQEVGTSAYWWNIWCEFLARTITRPASLVKRWFESAAEVSALHRLAIL